MDAHLVICIVGVAVTGMEVVFPLEGIFGGDTGLPAGDGQVLQTKLPVSFCVVKYCIPIIPPVVTIKSCKEDRLPAVHVVVALTNPVGLLKPERLAWKFNNKHDKTEDLGQAFRLVKSLGQSHK